MEVDQPYIQLINFIGPFFHVSDGHQLSFRENPRFTLDLKQTQFLSFSWFVSPNAMSHSISFYSQRLYIFPNSI